MAQKEIDLKALYTRKLENQKLSLLEFAEARPILRSRPSKLIVELTQNCNFKCIMCDQPLHEKYAHYDKALNMDMNLFERISKELFPDAYFVDLRGFGESLIYPHWNEVVDRLADFPLIDWHLVTNLSLRKDRAWEEMILRGFILGISFDGATAETFERIRVGSRFNSILHNLELVSDAVHRLDRGFLYFIVVVQGDNVDEIPEIVELARKHGVLDVQLKAVHPGPHNKHLGDWWKRAPSSMARSIDVALESGIRLTINDQKLLDGVDPDRASKAASVRYRAPNLNFHPPAGIDASETHELLEQVRENSKIAIHQRCFKPYHYTYFASDGKVGTCNHMLNPFITAMGDLNQNSFEEIWNGEAYQFFRVSLQRKMPMDRRCKWCFQHRLED